MGTPLAGAARPSVDQAACSAHAAEALWRDGFRYAKAGIVLVDVAARNRNVADAQSRALSDAD